MVGYFEVDDLGLQSRIQNVFRLIVNSQNPTKDDTCFKKLLDLIRNCGNRQFPAMLDVYFCSGCNITHEILYKYVLVGLH